ncbi:MAG: hypothetical protein HZC12_03740 [Nitrospirae bacterium]|nr:hypothetical protein [Nitrospirota bacterium]
MMTAYGTIDNAVEAMKVGAFHYITKPFRPDDLSGTIKKAVEFKKLGKENLDLKQPLKEKCSKDLVEHMEIFKVGIDSYRENDVVKIRDLQTVNSDQSTMNSFNGVDLVLAENGIDLNNVLEEFEKKLIFQALRASNGIKSRAARYLKLNRTTLIEKLKRLRIPD